MYHSPPDINTMPETQNAYGALDEHALMALVAGGNHTAFAEVVRRHSGPALRLAARTLGVSADAEDVVQTVFIKIWQRPLAWQSDKSAFSTWLYRVVLNACFDLQRQRQRQQGQTELSKAPEPSTADVAESHLQQEQTDLRQHVVQQAFKKLPHKQQDAINLAVYLALPQKQVAAIMGITVKAVESLLVRAKKSLKEHVGEQKSEAQQPNV